MFYLHPGGPPETVRVDPSTFGFVVQPNGINV